MDKENDFVLSDDAIAEQGKTAVVDDNFRSKFVDELGLTDDEDSKELIDKLVERETKLRSGYGELLGKKYIPLKQKYQELSTQLGANKDNKSLSPEETRKQQEQIGADRFNEEFLEDSEYSDEIKGEIRDWTKYKGVSAKVATKSPHIAAMIQAEAEAKRNAEAANNGNGEGVGVKTEGGKMPAQFNDPKYMITEEGQKAYAEWEKANKK